MMQPHVDVPTETLVHFGKLELPAAEARTLSNLALVARLVEIGTSRLSAARIIEVAREGGQCGRARSHPQSRRSI